MKITGANPTKVIRESCMVAKVLAALIFVLGALNALGQVFQDATRFSNWVLGVSTLLLVMGVALMTLLGYDVLCKAGFERSILTAFALIVAALVLSALANMQTKSKSK